MSPKDFEIAMWLAGRKGQGVEILGRTGIVMAVSEDNAYIELQIPLHAFQLDVRSGQWHVPTAQQHSDGVMRGGSSYSALERMRQLEIEMLKDLMRPDQAIFKKGPLT